MSDRVRSFIRPIALLIGGVSIVVGAFLMVDTFIPKEVEAGIYVVLAEFALGGLAFLFGLACFRFSRKRD
jgi:Zn-dependent protease with chaperone function